MKQFTDLLVVTSDDSDHVPMLRLWSLYRGPLSYRRLIKALRKKYGARINYSQRRYDGIRRVRKSVRRYGFAGIRIKSEMTKTVTAASTMNKGWNKRQMRWHLKQERLAREAIFATEVSE